MNRRSFIASVSAASAAFVAGCLGGDDSPSDEEYEIDPDAEMHELGEEVEYGGLRVTVTDAVVADHYAPYDCSGPAFWEDDTADAVECSPPADPSDLEEPPTTGGTFMFYQVTIRHVGQRRIDMPAEESAFNLVNQGYSEEVFLIEAPWVSASYVFPSYLFFVEQFEMDEQGVFPGVAVSGYIAFEVPIEADQDEYVAAISWEGNEDVSETVYWNIEESDIDYLTEDDAEDFGGDIFHEPRAGGIDWGEDGHPDDIPIEDWIRWDEDGEGEYEVPKDVWDPEGDSDDEEGDGEGEGDGDDDGFDFGD